MTRLVLALIFAVLAQAGGIAAADAQGFPLPFGTPAPTSTLAGYLTAPVVFNGRTLFTVASAPNSPNQLIAPGRAADIEAVLDQMLTIVGSGEKAHTAYDPDSLRIEVEQFQGQSVVAAVDAQHRTPLPIATVTGDDAAYAHLPVDAIAAQWQQTLQGALVYALSIRQPQSLQRSTNRALITFGALALLTFAASWLLLGLRRRIEALRDELARHDRELQSEQTRAAEEAAGAPDEERQRRLTAVLVRRLAPSQRLGLYETGRGAVVWSLLLIWFGAAIWVLLQFPQTSSLGNEVLHNAVVIAGIWLFTGLIDRILALAIGRLPALWDLRRYQSPDERARQQLRVPTIVRAMGGFKTTVLVFLAILATMTEVGIPIGSVVTIGGVAAIAVSLAAQNIIRDFVSGFLVLAEDQYVVGDYVTINGMSGLVERLTLRMVQIRDASGNLITISHSAATSVINRSRNWSRVDYRVSIDPTADVGRAIDIVRGAIDQLSRDRDWHEAVRGAAEWVGVDSFSRDGIVIRAQIKTAPLHQFAVERELNLRVARALAEAKVGFGAAPPAPTP